MNLLPQDVLVLLKLAVSPGVDWTYGNLSHDLVLSGSMVHSAVRRAMHARLLHDRRPRRKALEEFLVHGVKYAFAPEVGPITRGIPTAFAAPVFRNEFGSFDDEVNKYVWPHPMGDTLGMELEPLHKSVPEAVKKDPALYDALAVLDAIRIGRTRERSRAEELLQEMLKNATP